MNWCYRLALACWAIPLGAGLAVFLLWLPTRWRTLETLGFFTIPVGVLLSMAGAGFLFVYLIRDLCGSTPPHRRVWLRAAILFSLLISNYLICWGIITVVQAIKYPEKSIDVPDVTRRQELHLKAATGDGSILILRLTGRIDGDAHIAIGNQSGELTKGDVSWGLGCDWFEPEATFIYTPGNVTQGRLTLTYQFR